VICLVLVPVGVGAALPATSVAPAHSVSAGVAATGDSCGMSVELVPKCGIWWGAHASIGWSAFESVIGRKLAIVHDYVDWTETFPSANEELAAAGNRIIFVDWSALNFATGDADTSWEGIANGSQDPIIDAEAAVLKSFGQKIMVTFQAEPEQSVYASYGTAAEYVAAWQHIAARFAADKVTNVVWVWDVEGDVYDHGSTYQDWYPGDADVDWIMWDPYNWFGCNGDSDPWQTFADIVTPMYNWLTTHSGTAGNGDYLSKPWGLGEYGTIEGASSTAEEQWYESVASESQAQFPNLKALVYFDSDDTTNGRTCDWEVNSSVQSLNGYQYAGSQSYTNQMPYAAQPSSTTTITSTTSSPVVGQPITVDVQVAGSDAGSGVPAPSGDVTVSDGTQNCEASLSGSGGVSIGSCAITEDAPGAYSFTASYPGDSNFGSSATASATPVTVESAASSTSITASTSAPVVGQPIAIGVAVSGQFTGSSVPAPSGDVTVSDGTQHCQALLSGSDGASSGSCDITEDADGGYSFTASYPSDTNFGSSATASATPVTVAKAPSSTTISSTTSAPVVGQPIAIDVAVGGQFTGSGVSAPSGDVTVSDGSLHCDAPLSGSDGASTGSCDITEDAAGGYSFTASYPSDTNFGSSATVGATPVTVESASSSTTISSTTANPVPNQPIAIDVSVSGQFTGAGVPAPTGDVSVSDGTQTCQAPLSGSGGVAIGSCDITEDVAGGYSFTASYPGDPNFALSTSSPAVVTVGEEISATTITSTASAPVVGQPITIDVQVGSGVPAPTGDVTVSDGTRSCQAPLTGSSGVASGSCAITEDASGAYSFTASYPGDSNFDSSDTASPTPVTVESASSSTTITATTSAPVVGQPIAIGVSVSGQFTGSRVPAPSGDVTVSDGTQHCQALLSGSDGASSGSCDITEYVPRGYSFTASYPSDSNFGSSATASATPAAVAKAPSSTAITSMTPDPVSGQPITVRVSVTAKFTGSRVPAPAGDVTVSAGTRTCGAVLSGSGGVGTGICRITENVEGSYVFGATYQGDSSFHADSSGGTSVTVGGVPTIMTDPSSLTVSVGEQVTFNAQATGVPAPTVVWQVSTDGGGNWNRLSDATATSYNLTATATDNGSKYRAVFTNRVRSVPTSAATLMLDGRGPPQGFWLASANGSVFAAGSAPPLGGAHAPSSDPVVGIASTSDGKGYWLVTANGSVYSFGDARYHGSLPGLGVRVTDIVAIAPTGNGEGYWMIGRDGGEFAFGDAQYHGSLPGLGLHVADVVGMVATSNGDGYWLVGSDGGVFAFGNAHFVGSLPDMDIHVVDIVAMIPSPTRDGYVLVGADGGAFVYGSGVHYFGSLPGKHILVSDIVGLALTPDTLGYWFAGAGGGTYAFGDGENFAVPASVRYSLPVVAIAPA
jgi:Bacterial Ig-like domain (group 3)/Immunoglobulin I-set domain